MILRLLSFYAYVAKGHLVSVHEAVFFRQAMLLGRRKLLREGLMARERRIRRPHQFSCFPEDKNTE